MKACHHQLPPSPSGAGSRTHWSCVESSFINSSYTSAISVTVTRFPTNLDCFGRHTTSPEVVQWHMLIFEMV